MLNYALNKENSKTFIKYYKKIGDNLEVHYGNGTTSLFPDSTEIREKIHSKMDGQLDTYNSNIDFQKETAAILTSCSVAFLIFGGVIFAPMLEYVGTPEFALVLKKAPFVEISSFFGAASAVCQGFFLKKARVLLDYKKNLLFRKYKSEIQEYLTADENSKELNHVEKEVFTINDAHFTSYLDMKKMTKNIQNILDEIDADKKRDEDLGTVRTHKSFKQLVKQYR